MSQPEEWYHVTYSRLLPSICRNGLRPGHGNSMGSSGSYTAHSRGKLFLTEWDGVRFWFNKAEEYAEHYPEKPYTEGWTPVVLRFIAKGLPYEVDDVGSVDANAKAVFTRETVPAESIDVWDGEEWIVLEDHDTIDMSQAYTFEEDDDDPDETLEYFKSDSPLMPTEP